SARLMQAAGNGILCDLTTREATADKFAFDPLPPLQVKGKAARIEVFRPLGQVAVARVARPMVGRHEETQALTDRLHELKGEQGGVLIVEGEAGMGKSRLLSDLVSRARQHGVHALIGHADPIHPNTPLYVWREIFGDIEAEPLIPPELVPLKPLLQ